MSKRPRIESLLRRFRSARRPATGPLTLHRRRLLTEPLEDRRMLSVVTVNNNLDLVNGDTSSIANLIANDGGDGIALREALDAANNTAGADTINFDVALADSTITLGGTELTILDGLTLTGLGADQLTIDAQSHARVMRVAPGVTAQISGLTLTGGGNVGNGGGVDNHGYLTITDSVITGNHLGPGITRGGGVDNQGGLLSVQRSTISNNSAGYGGGVSDEFGTGTISITDSTISGNSALSAFGGGVLANSTPLSITSSTISGNSSAGYGGGVVVAHGTATFTHSTIVDNTSATYGGGGINTTYFGGATLDHTIVANNTATSSGPDVSGPVTANWSLIKDTSGATLSGANNITGLDPMLGPLQDNGGPTFTHALLAGSPAIDAGDPAAVAGVGNVPQYDQRTAPFGRVVGTIDIGAYEAQSLSMVVDTAVDESDGDYSPGDLSLREALQVAYANPGADTINFDVALAGSTITLGGTQLTINNDVTINGLGADQLTIDAGGLSRVMNVTNNATAYISGLTLTGGNADRGGGLRNYAGSVTALSDVTIEGNQASNDLETGAGVWNAGDLTVADSRITGNTGTGSNTYGGGVWSNGTLSITRTTISGNSSYDGGGIYSPSGTFTITDSTISNNTVTDDGGGIFAYGTVAITGSTISGNVSGGSGNAVGGGIYAANATISHSTIVDNTIDGLGGGIFAGFGTVALDHTIVANNTATSGGPDIHGSVTANWSLMENTSGATIGGANNITGLDPMLGPLADNGGPTQTHDLLPGSPALGAGDPAAVAGVGGVPLYDQRGAPFGRVVGVIDIGAVESLRDLVVDTAVDESDGDYSPGDLSLREALELTNANPGADVIDFAPGLAGSTINLMLGQLTITDDVTINGLGADQLTIDAQGASRVLSVGAGTTDTISGLTLTGGGNVGNGGGVYNHGYLTIADSVITGNHLGPGTTRGGGVDNQGGLLSVQRSTISNNSAGYGGGVSDVYGTGTISITGSTISGNSATTHSGGGIYSNQVTLSITNTTISGNSSASDGGGVLNHVGNLTITDSTVSGNSASGSAGGIWNAGDLTITDSTISNNSTTVGSGGGVFNVRNLTVTDSTVSGNSAYGSGGGIFSNTDSDYVTTVTTITGSTISGNTAAQGGGVCNNNGLTDIRYSTITLNDASTSGDGVWSFGDSATRTDVGSSIIAGNVGNDDVHTNGVTNEFVSLGYNLIGGGNDAGAFIAAGDQTGVTDPMLGPLADNGGPTQTHALLAGSPALNAGDPAAVAGVGGVPLYDQRGAPFGRVVGVIDIGAVESLHNFIVDTAVDESDGDYSPGDLSLREALELTNANPGADVIDFAPGLAGSTINLVLGQLTISDDVTINGLGASDLTIDAQGASRVMAVTNSATADISGLTLTGGNAGRGGGLRNYAGSTTTLTAVVIDTNTATTSSGGGGIWNAGNLTITDSTISNNSTTTGGGGGILSSGNLTVADSTVSGNSAFSGGGGVLNSGNLTMTDSTVSGNSASGNSASGNGGGVYNLGDLTLTNSTVSGNSASVSGGGIWSSTSSDYVTTVTTITGSTISGNTAAQGGGVFNLNGLTTIHYSTITLNDASTSGDGVWSFGDSYTRTDVGSSIIAGNVGNDDVHTNGVSNEFVSLGYNLIGGGNDAGAFGATGDQTGVTDPMLGALTDNGGPTFTHALLPGSPAIDAGDPTAVAGVGGVPLYDQRGMNYERVQAGRIDIGAYELLLADGNLDGQVDGLDYLIWASHYPDNPAADPPGTPQNGDYNNDGKVDGVDYLLWASQYLEGTPAVAASQPAASTQEQLAAVDTTFANAYSVGATVQDWQVSQAFDAVLNHDTVLKHKDK